MFQEGNFCTKKSTTNQTGPNGEKNTHVIWTRMLNTDL